MREMTGATCQFQGDRDETLIAFLYEDIDAAERTTFEAHLRQCAPCRSELTSLGGVRERLAQWTPPTYGGIDRQAPGAARSTWWRDVPAWAQVAAALLFL